MQERRYAVENVKIALYENDLETIKLNVKAFPDLLEIRINEWEYPIHVVCEYGYLDILKFMIDEWQNNQIEQPCKLTGFTPLMIAAQLGRHEIVKYLLTKGAKFDIISSKSGRDALIIAREGFHTKVC